MWMMGCNDGSGFNMSDSFNSRKLRPLMPRPISYCPNTATATPPPCLSSLHGADLFGSNNHMASPTEQSKQEFSAQPVVSSRWNPTPEQLGTLEELYRQGTRTPTAEQIQHITAQLRRFGKIEGKNVFYWFQNHKARERQKRRRQLESNAGEQQFCEIQSLERKESGSSRTSFEVEQTRNWAHPTNCSTLAQESVSMQRAAVAESRIDGWIQIEQGELHQRRSSIERHATWPMMQLSCSHPSQLLNTITTTTTEAMTTVDPRLISNQNLNIFITATRENQVDGQNSEECREFQTLQLFPLRSDKDNGADNYKETELPIATMNTDFIPCQFFEFLPLKN